MIIDKIIVNEKEYQVKDSSVQDWARQKETPIYDDTEIKEELNDLGVEVQANTLDIGSLSNNQNEIVKKVEEIDTEKANRTEIPDVSEFVKKLLII